MKVDSLVKMANQIAVSVPDQSSAVEQTATHLRSFWTPVMIDDLDSYRRQHPDSVSATVRSALDVLRPGGSHG